MNAFMIRFILLVWILALSGCTAGRIYNHTIKPLDVNMNRTPAVFDQYQGDIKHFQYSLVDIQWDSNAIGDIAKQYGMETVYYVDKEVFSILGIWTQEKIHVYGR